VRRAERAQLAQAAAAERVCSGATVDARTREQKVDEPRRPR
jgi:hypothetical protein